MAIQWTPELSVGIEIIDNQHMELLNRITKLLEACNLGKGKEEVGKECRGLDYQSHKNL